MLGTGEQARSHIRSGYTQHRPQRAGEDGVLCPVHRSAEQLHWGSRTLGSRAHTEQAQRQDSMPDKCAREGPSTHQLDVVDGLLLELLKRPLGLRLQGEGEALQRLVLAFHTDLRLHLGTG